MKDLRVYKENDLFRPSENWPMNACVGRNGGPYDYADYAKGYFEAGKRLVTSIYEDHKKIDVLVYPLVFIYRHAIELGLKHLIKVLPKLLDETGDITFTHKLIDNWNSVAKLLRNLPAEWNDEKAIVYFDKVLKDFVQIDPRGETFRFPEDKSGSLFLQDSCLINIEVFSDTLIEVAEIFEFWFDGIDIVADYKSEMLSYFLDY